MLVERVIKQEQRWSSLLPPALWMGQRRGLWASHPSLTAPTQRTRVQQGQCLAAEAAAMRVQGKAAHGSRRAACLLNEIRAPAREES